jgi:hypothetical protein
VACLPRPAQRLQSARGTPTSARLATTFGLCAWNPVGVALERSHGAARRGICRHKMRHQKEEQEAALKARQRSQAEAKCVQHPGTTRCVGRCISMGCRSTSSFSDRARPRPRVHDVGRLCRRRYRRRRRSSSRSPPTIAPTTSSSVGATPWWRLPPLRRRRSLPCRPLRRRRHRRRCRRNSPRVNSRRAPRRCRSQPPHSS